MMTTMVFTTANKWDVLEKYPIRLMDRYTLNKQANIFVEYNLAKSNKKSYSYYFHPYSFQLTYAASLVQLRLDQ